MRYKSLLILLISLTVSSFGQNLLTLEQAVKIALNQNTLVNKSTNTLAGTQSRIKSSYGALLPNVSASAGWSWSRTDNNSTTADINGTSITIPSSSYESRSFNLGMNAQTTLYDGLASYKHLAIAEDNYKAGKLDLERVKQDLVYKVISNYYLVCNALENVTVSEEDLKWNTKNLEVVTARNKLGSVTLADVYQQQVKVGNAELALIKAKNSYETLKTNFLYTLGLDVLADYKFEKPTAQLTKIDQMSETDGIEKDVNQLYAEAIAKRVDVESSKIRLNNAAKSVEATKARYLPTISNTISYSLTGNAVDKVLDTRNLYFGLNLSVPIFTGWGISSAVEQAEIEVKNQELDALDLERLIKKDLQQSTLDIQASVKKLDVGRKNVKAAEETRRIEEEKYRLGATTLLNVLIANSDYTNAITNYINSKFEYLSLKSELEYNIGTMDLSKYENK